MFEILYQSRFWQETDGALRMGNSTRPKWKNCTWGNEYGSVRDGWRPCVHMGFYYHSRLVLKGQMKKVLEPELCRDIFLTDSMAAMVTTLPRMVDQVETDHLYYLLTLLSWYYFQWMTCTSGKGLKYSTSMSLLGQNSSLSGIKDKEVCSKATQHQYHVKEDGRLGTWLLCLLYHSVQSQVWEKPSHGYNPFDCIKWGGWR